MFSAHVDTWRRANPTRGPVKVARGAIINKRGGAAYQTQRTVATAMCMAGRSGALKIVGATWKYRQGFLGKGLVKS